MIGALGLVCFRIPGILKTLLLSISLKMKVKVIDLFAGPGGLGEGFSAFKSERNSRPFHLEMSVEKEASAHQTLELRALFRQFRTPPKPYYDYLKGDISREQLFSRYPAKSRKAREETLFGPRELGPNGDDDVIFSRLEELKSSHDEGWLVIGGPPCQAYSLVGRARNRGTRGYKAEEDRRHFLYEEYLKVLQCIRPEVFVMENVKGILSSKVNGQYVFPRLLEDLRCPDQALGKKPRSDSRYRIYSLVSGIEISEISGSGSDCVIRTEEYGVPQARHRVILLGVREDSDKRPTSLARSSSMFSVGECIAGIPRLRSGLSKADDSAESWHTAIDRQANRVARELRSLGLDGNAALVSANRAHRIASRGGRFVRSSAKYSGPKHLSDWIPDGHIGGFLNHDTRGHIESDLGRYLFCSIYAEQRDGQSPKAHDFPESLSPSHANWKSGKFADRFKVPSCQSPIQHNY